MSHLQPVSPLALARQHVESGRRVIAAQEALVAEIKNAGGDPELAESILASFRRTQVVFEEELALLSRHYHEQSRA